MDPDHKSGNFVFGTRTGLLDKPPLQAYPVTGIFVNPSPPKWTVPNDTLLQMESPPISSLRRKPLEGAGQDADDTHGHVEECLKNVLLSLKSEDITSLNAEQPSTSDSSGHSSDSSATLQYDFLDGGEEEAWGGEEAASGGPSPRFVRVLDPRMIRSWLTTRGAHRQPTPLLEEDDMEELLVRLDESEMEESEGSTASSTQRLKEEVLNKEMISGESYVIPHRKGCPRICEQNYKENPYASWTLPTRIHATFAEKSDCNYSYIPVEIIEKDIRDVLGDLVNLVVAQADLGSDYFNKKHVLEDGIQDIVDDLVTQTAVQADSSSDFNRKNEALEEDIGITDAVTDLGNGSVAQTINVSSDSREKKHAPLDSNSRGSVELEQRVKQSRTSADKPITSGQERFRRSRSVFSKFDNEIQTLIINVKPRTDNGADDRCFDPLRNPAETNALTSYPEPEALKGPIENNILQIEQTVYNADEVNLPKKIEHETAKHVSARENLRGEMAKSKQTRVMEHHAKVPSRIDSRIASPSAAVEDIHSTDSSRSKSSKPLMEKTSDKERHSSVERGTANQDLENGSEAKSFEFKSIMKTSRSAGKHVTFSDKHSEAKESYLMESERLSSEPTRWHASKNGRARATRSSTEDYECQCQDDDAVLRDMLIPRPTAKSSQASSADDGFEDVDLTNGRSDGRVVEMTPGHTLTTAIESRPKERLKSPDRSEARAKSSRNKSMGPFARIARVFRKTLSKL